MTTVALVLATACVDLVVLQLAAETMDCCAKSDYECAGIQAPDDCCQNMGHAVRLGPTATPQSKMTAPGPLLATVATVTVAVPRRADRASSSPAFKRPHDPPHLHPIALLI